MKNKLKSVSKAALAAMLTASLLMGCGVAGNENGNSGVDKESGAESVVSDEQGENGSGTGSATDGSGSETDDGITDGSGSETDDGITDGGDTDGNTETTNAGSSYEEITGNGTYFVRYGSKVYFHAATEENLNEITLWADYSNTYTGATALYCYDEETGELTKLQEDESYGPLGITGDTLVYYNNIAGNDNPYMESSVRRYRLEKEINEDLNCSYGNKIFVDDAGTFAVYISDMSDEDGTSLVVLKDGDEYNQLPLENEFNVAIGLAGDQFLYAVRNFDDSYTILQIDLNDGSRVTLGDLPAFLSGWVTIDQFEYVDNTAYFSFDNYDGTGNMYQTGYWVSAAINQENALTFKEKNEEYEALYFYVKNGKMEPAKQIPGSVFVDYNTETIGYIDEEGEYVTVAEGNYVDAYDDEENIRNKIENATKIGDTIYAIRVVADRAPEEDIGWRYAYKRTGVQYVKIDVATGDEQILLELK